MPLFYFSLDQAVKKKKTSKEPATVQEEEEEEVVLFTAEGGDEMPAAGTSKEPATVQEEEEEDARLSKAKKATAEHSRSEYKIMNSGGLDDVFVSIISRKELVHNALSTVYLQARLGANRFFFGDTFGIENKSKSILGFVIVDGNDGDFIHDQSVHVHLHVYDIRTKSFHDESLDVHDFLSEVANTVGVTRQKYMELPWFSDELKKTGFVMKVMFLCALQCKNNE